MIVEATRVEYLRQQCAIDRELLRRRCEKSLYWFFRSAWNLHLERSTPFVDNWHYRVLCDALQEAVERVLARQPRQQHLIVCLPPRTAKSSIISVALPAWIWARRPEIRFLTGSSTERLAMDFALKTRALIDSPWYQQCWGNQFVLRDDQNVKSYYVNSAGGARYATSVGGQASGFGGDIVLIDDPLELKDALSDSASEAAYQWYTNVVEQRLNDQEKSLVIINHQRFSVRDLAGLLLERQPQRFRLLCLPAEAIAPVHPEALRAHYRDGLLFPERLGRGVLDDRRVAMGTWQYEAQFNQRPSSAEGGLFKRRWWGYWVPPGSTYPAVVRMHDDGSVSTARQRTLPEQFENLVAAWDMSFKGKADSDRVAGGVFGADAQGDKYLLDVVVGTMGFLDAVSAVAALYERWRPRGLNTVLIEDTANGPAVIETLRGRVPCLVPIQVAGMSKVQRAADGSRAISALAQVEAGRVWLPHPACAPWVDAFIEECAVFPNGRHDDMVDMLVHGIRRLSSAVLPGAFAV